MEGFQPQLDTLRYRKFNIMYSKNYSMTKQSFISTIQKWKKVSILGNVEGKFIILTH